MSARLAARRADNAELIALVRSGLAMLAEEAVLAVVAGWVTLVSSVELGCGLVAEAALRADAWLRGGGR